MAIKLLLYPENGGEIMDETIYTVFPKGYDKEYESFYMPQDFSTYEEAKEYGESLDCDYDIESA